MLEGEVRVENCQEKQKEEFCLYMKPKGDTENKTQDSLTCMGVKDRGFCFKWHQSAFK